MEVLTAHRLLEDTRRLGSLVGRSLDTVADRVEEAVHQRPPGRLSRIVLSGSGDLHNIAESSTNAVEALTGVTTLAAPSMTAGLYLSSFAGPQTLWIQMSWSGRTDRALEAAGLAAHAGATVWAVSNVGDSPLMQLASVKLLNDTDRSNESAGYLRGMLMLWFAAIALGERNRTLTRAKAVSLRRLLLTAPDHIETTVAATDPQAKELAERARDSSRVEFFASGPNLGTASNSAARVIEATGRHACVLDIEEWFHLERFSHERSVPYFIIVPPGEIRHRAFELVDALNGLGSLSITVAERHDSDRPRGSSLEMLVDCPLPEVFSPVVYSVPGELFANHLGVVLGTDPFRAGDPRYDESGELRWGGHIVDQVGPPLSRYSGAQDGLESRTARDASLRHE